MLSLLKIDYYKGVNEYAPPNATNLLNINLFCNGQS